MENIDDDCDQHNIAFVKISDVEEAKEYGIDSLPTLVFFEKRIPHVYEGNDFIMIQIILVKCNDYKRKGISIFQ